MIENFLDVTFHMNNFWQMLRNSICGLGGYVNYLIIMIMKFLYNTALGVKQLVAVV